MATTTQVKTGTGQGQRRAGPIIDPSTAPAHPVAGPPGKPHAPVPTEPRVQATTLVPGDANKPRVVIMRSLQGPRVYDPGEVIEVHDLQRRKALRNSRRIRELEYGEELHACPCGRVWAGQQRAQQHDCA